MLLRCCAAAAAAAGEVHAGPAEVPPGRRGAAVSASSAGVGQSPAPALASAPSPAPHTPVPQLRAPVRPVRRATLHTGGERGQSGARGAAAARERVRRTSQNGE